MDSNVLGLREKIIEIDALPDETDDVRLPDIEIQFSRFYHPHIEHVVNQVEHKNARCLQSLKVPQLFLAQDVLQLKAEEIAHSHDHGQRIAQVMGNRTDQPVLLFVEALQLNLPRFQLLI